MQGEILIASIQEGAQDQLQIVTSAFDEFLDALRGNDAGLHSHLVVEDLGLAGSGVGDEAVVEDVENILADPLELLLDLDAVLLDGGHVLVGALGLLLLLDRGDDAPRGTAGANNVLVGNRQQVALVDRELAADLGNLLHVGNHLIVALSLLAQAGEESLAVARLRGQQGVPYGGHLLTPGSRWGHGDPSKRTNKPFTLEIQRE